MSDAERRFAEFRVAEDGTITGTVIRYGDRASFGGFTEEFRAGSLVWGDTIVNLQHDRARPVARTGAGLTLTGGPASLRASIALPDTAYAREARELVQARILRGFSVEFRADAETWDGRHRIVEGATLLGLALVDTPAYPESTIEARLAVLHAGAPGGESATPRYWY